MSSSAFVLLTVAIAAGVDPVPSGIAWVRVENDQAGAGFVVDTDRRWLVTCRHLVADRRTVDVFFPWVEQGRLITDRAAYLRNRTSLRERGLVVTGTVRRTSEAADLALVELARLPAGTAALVLAQELPVPGETLCVVGHRLDLETLWNVTIGPLRATGRLTDGYFWRGTRLAADAHVLIGQLPIEEGDSGGPVLNTRGEVVGLAAALRRQCPLAAVCVSAAEITAFLRETMSAGAAPPAPAAGPPPPPVSAGLTVAESLHRATVWVRPTATDGRHAGVLIAPDLVLTVAQGLRIGDRVGIALPVQKGNRWIGERSAYLDPLTLALGGHWREATVLAHDPSRNLALLRLAVPAPEPLRPLSLAAVPPRPGDPVHTMNHPGGLEFAWVYAAGSVRQIGQVRVSSAPEARPVEVLLCQLPVQAGSPGGPLADNTGKLVGLVLPRESTQMVGYAVTAAEITHFLDAMHRDRPPRTLSGLLARWREWPKDWAWAMAGELARRADQHLRSGDRDAAATDARHALALDPGCVAARLVQARLLLTNDQTAAAFRELDTAREHGPFDRNVLLLQAELAAELNDWRSARGSLERLLDVSPTDAEARQRLIGVLLELGETARAATAVHDTLRTDPRRTRSVAADLLAQADRLAQKYPDDPSIPLDWLRRALTAADRPEFAAALRAAVTNSDTTVRLAAVRGELKRLTK